MILKKRTFNLLALLSLLYLAFFFITFSNQPYYHSGFKIKLNPDGFHIQHIVPGSNAAKAGLKEGMIISNLNDYDTIQLYQIAHHDLPSFLSVSSKFFSFGTMIQIKINTGIQYHFIIDRLPWSHRFFTLNKALMLNQLIGALFIIFGVWLLALGRKEPASIWFLLFCIAAGITLSVSYFDSYWSAELLKIRFITLDITGIATGIFLICFVYHFPVPKKFHSIVVFVLPLTLLALKYGLYAFELIPFYGTGNYLVLCFLALSFIYAVFLLFRRYREVKAGDKRRLRWIIAGTALSLVPYSLFIISIVISSNMLKSSPDFFYYICSVGILFFPIFVIIGVVKYNLFDIDRFLNRFCVLFVMGVIVSSIYLFVFLVFFESKRNPGFYITVLLTAFISPVLYHLVEKWIGNFLFKDRRDKKQILHDMENKLVGIYKIEAVYSIVSKALVSAFDPSYIAFIQIGTDGLIKTEYSFPFETVRGTRGIIDDDISFPLYIKNQNADVLVIGKNRDDDIYTKDDIHLLTSAAAQIAKTQENCDLYHRLLKSQENESNAQRGAILALAKLTEYRDKGTGRHLQRISVYTRLIAQQLKVISIEKTYLTDAYIEDLCLSSILHDIGKVGISDNILMNPGKLSIEEFEDIKAHTIIGGNVLEETELLSPSGTFLSIGKLVAYHHHEKWDGTGYPYGLKGNEIPLSARIVAIADVYDALMSERPYKNAFSHEQAKQVILEGRGKHFDPELVDVFFSIESAIKDISRTDYV